MRMTITAQTAIILTSAAILSAAACSNSQSAQAPAPAPAAAPASPAAPSYVPGLGEIMTLNQMRHTKLWFAGQAGNWGLAAYELEELHEGLDDAATFHPTHKDGTLLIPPLIDKIMKEPMEQVEKAVNDKDAKAFPIAFDALTAGCNSCHQATDFGINVVIRLTSNPYTNQAFAPPK